MVGFARDAEFATRPWVRGRIDPDRLMGSNVRDPAALAEVACGVGRASIGRQMAPDAQMAVVTTRLLGDPGPEAEDEVGRRRPGCSGRDPGAVAELAVRESTAAEARSVTVGGGDDGLMARPCSA